MSDIRTSQRFPVHLPIRVIGSEQAPQDGVTENFSAGGVYLTVDSNLKVGSEIEFEVTIPGETIGVPGEVHLRCQGRVLRSDEGNQSNKTGVACVLDKYEFLRAASGGK